MKYNNKKYHTILKNAIRDIITHTTHPGAVIANSIWEALQQYGSSMEQKEIILELQANLDDIYRLFLRDTKSIINTSHKRLH